jgi:hypothetical protein
VALEIEAMASIGVNADAKPYAIHSQEGFPYFTNRIAASPVTPDGGVSEEFDVNQPLVIMRLVVGHVTEGYKGQPEGKLYEWGPVIKTYFQSRMWLQTVSTGAYPARMANLRADSRITDTGGFRIFDNSGIGVSQVGREFQLQCYFDEFITQVYD